MKASIVPSLLGCLVVTSTWRNPIGRSSCVPCRRTFLHSMGLSHGTNTKGLMSAFLCRAENEVTICGHMTVILPDILPVLVTVLLL